MAVLLYPLTALALLLIFLGHKYRCLARNIAAAKRSGLRYVVLPVHQFNFLWLLTARLWLPLLDRLPKSWTASWLSYMKIDWAFYEGYKPFADLGEDVIILVAPDKNHVYIADPTACADITSRRVDFPKPIEIYKTLDLYGKNVVSSEGSVWRQHRKLTAPSFSERNNELVFTESVQQASAMVRHWFGGGSGDSLPPAASALSEADIARANETPTITNPGMDAMKFALHIISIAGFGVQMFWPHEEQIPNGKTIMGSKTIPTGHTMTYHSAISTLLERVFLAAALPMWIIQRLPFPIFRDLYQSSVEWGKYMTELLEQKKSEIIAGEDSEGMDLLGALIRGTGVTPESLASKTKASGQILSDSEVLGNAFIFMLAGHETTANVIHHSLIMLAMNPESQRLVQADMDKVLSNKPVKEWDYETDYPIIANSMAAAVVNECLRIFSPVTIIPKCTRQAQPLTLRDGRRIIIPDDCAISLDTCALHSNPKYWPNAPGFKPRFPGDNDLTEFRPERWMVDPSITSQHDDDASEAEDAPPAAPTSSRILKPARGLYIPFSDGYRSCLGKRFAQVEVNTVMALIFRDYSVELAVDAFATDEQVAAMPHGGPERHAIWESAKESAIWKINHCMASIITLQMRDAHVPLRLVKRGNERFM